MNLTFPLSNPKIILRNIVECYPFLHSLITLITVSCYNPGVKLPVYISTNVEFWIVVTYQSFFCMQIQINYRNMFSKQMHSEI